MFSWLLNFFNIQIVDEPVKKLKSREDVRRETQSAYLQHTVDGKFFVYHIYKIKGEVSTGYIGVTNNFEARKFAHFEELENSCHLNKALQAAFNRKEFTRNNMVILHAGLTEAGAYAKEFELRPKHHMGWNLNIGGKDVDYTSQHYQMASRSKLDFSSPTVINKQEVREFFKEIRDLYVETVNDLSDSINKENEVKFLPPKKAESSAQKKQVPLAPLNPFEHLNSTLASKPASFADSKQIHHSVTLLNTESLNEDEETEKYLESMSGAGYVESFQVTSLDEMAIDGHYFQHHGNDYYTIAEDDELTYEQYRQVNDYPTNELFELFIANKWPENRVGDEYDEYLQAYNTHYYMVSSANYGNDAFNELFELDFYELFLEKIDWNKQPDFSFDMSDLAWNNTHYAISESNYEAYIKLCTLPHDTVRCEYCNRRDYTDFELSYDDRASEYN
ncbi:hypothetical protein [Shewanella glacialipiscicola]|uniref:hypothetical protein n=1 Tax=Shewanella glacialipiscicola TaxID=614069 RepID=UPI003D79882F